ncbi:MAG: hypothetical protein AB4063_11010 [Crocosphaera sp.]
MPFPVTSWRAFFDFAIVGGFNPFVLDFSLEITTVDLMAIALLFQ